MVLPTLFQSASRRGEIVLLDRSWYNRAVVERVMGFCTTTEYREFMEQTPGLEQALVDSGIRLIKLWFSVSRAEQRTRFTVRVIDPLRQEKLSPVDLAPLDRWDDYTRATSDVVGSPLSDGSCPHWTTRPRTPMWSAHLTRSSSAHQPRCTSRANATPECDRIARYQPP